MKSKDFDAEKSTIVSDQKEDTSSDMSTITSWVKDLVAISNKDTTDETLDDSPGTPISTATTATTTSSTSKSFKSKQSSNSTDGLLHVIENRLSSIRQKDEYNAIEKVIAAKLRTLETQQKIFAEKIISDTWYEA
ncbi:unnamed protein product [Euphydryas editha]|uniref:Uncharacterized protein n=1 Tax=Euphydryas editha TaxID=104508 RepID=A0AAU9UQ69_EUPED|nr:unnamed protein product [Euphydryas editha]